MRKHNLLFTIMIVKGIFIIIEFYLNFHFIRYNFLNFNQNNIKHFPFLFLIISK